MYDDRNGFCACSFIDNVYVIGGYLRGSTNSCLKYNTKDQSWTEVAKLNEARDYAACAVFKGTIVVSGGYNNPEGRLKTVLTIVLNKNEKCMFLLQST